MIIGIGTDIVKVSRIHQNIVNKVLSEEEKERMDSFLSDLRKMEFLAGRFAAKEAMKKAMPFFENFKSMTELVIMNDETGQPYLKSPVYKDKIIHISISHEREFAIGLCVIEKSEL